MAPTGVPILRPPANPLPPGIEWQATQSATRAKYSSRLPGEPALPGSRRVDLCPDTRTRQANIPPAHSKVTPPKRTALEATERIALCRSAKIGIHNRQRTNALARCGEDGIRHCGGDGRDGGLSGAAPDISPARYQVHIDPRRLRKTHHAISVEIALYRGAVLDRDLAVQGGTQPKDYRALSLLGDRLRIDHVTGIERDGDSIDLHLAVWLHRNFGDLRAEAVRKIANGNAAPAALWQRLAPVALLGGGIQHLEPVRLALQKFAPHVIGIETVRRRELVEEAFDGESMLIGTGRAIEPYRQVGIPGEHFYVRVRYVVCAAHQAVDGRRLSFVGRKRNANRLEDRRGYDTHRPRGRYSVGAGHGLESDHRVRTKPVVAGVFLPRPDQLDWTFDDLRDGDGLQYFIVCIATAEASPEERVVDVDLLRPQAGRACSRAERRLCVLRSHPDVEPVGLQIHGRIHRLHWRVR